MQSAEIEADEDDDDRLDSEIIYDYRTLLQIEEHSQNEQDQQVTICHAKRLPCIAHTIQLALKDAFRKVPSAEKVIKEASSVVVFFHRSLYWGCELKKKPDGRKLLSAVPTRWNSNMIMLRRLSTELVWKAVSEILVKAKASPSSTSVPRLTSSRTQILDLVSILTPFEEATNSLQGDGVTISLVIPALMGIDSVLSFMQTQFPSLQKHLRQALHDRFQDIICSDEYILATLLDCRYKLMPFIDSSRMMSQQSDQNQSQNSLTLQPKTRAEATLCLSRAFASETAWQMTSHMQQSAEPQPTQSTTSTRTTAESVPSIFSMYSDICHMQGK
jgi:hypothetical protein